MTNPDRARSRIITVSNYRVTTRLQAAGAGILAAVAGLAVSSGISSLLTGVPSPVIAVGNRVIDVTPTPVKNWAIEAFGDADKPILIGSVLAVIVLFAAAAGVIGLRRPTIAIGMTAVLGVAALGISATDRTASAPAFLVVLPSILALIVSMSALAWLLATLARRKGDTRDRWLAPHPGDDIHSPFDRRRFLVAAMATGAAVAAGGVVTTVFGGAAATDSRRTVAGQIPVPSDPAGPVPAGTQLKLDGITEYVTPNDDFYRVDTALTVPDVPADTWTLRIHGMVDNEVELSFEDLLGMRLIERRVTLTCVSNQVGGLLAGNATWIGVPLKDLLEAAGVQSGADAVFATSADGWTCATAISDMIDREGFLAISMNGEPLPLEHGFPARVVVPGLYGMVSATKWVVDLEITKLDDVEAYWTARNWSERAPIKTQSRIDTPRGFQQLTPAEDGTLTMGGVAWAQTTGIAKVEVRIDDEPWQDATLGTEDTLATWRLWTWTWDAPTAGNHNITVRATDRSGYTQTSDQAETLPDGATGWHNIQFVVT
jgi:DMSO/TMAO reductase YedYZ molybdopterin-dependent catalytic subunit